MFLELRVLMLPIEESIFVIFPVVPLKVIAFDVVALVVLDSKVVKNAVPVAFRVVKFPI